MDELNELENLYYLIDKVKGTTGDPEIAHSFEDKLHIKYLEFIAHNQGQHTYYTIQLLAKEILDLQELDFDRWRA